MNPVQKADVTILDVATNHHKPISYTYGSQMRICMCVCTYESQIISYVYTCRPVNGTNYIDDKEEMYVSKDLYASIYANLYTHA